MKYLLLFLSILPSLALSQNDVPTISNDKFCISMVPQYAIIDGIRLDLDIRLNDKNHWMVVAPQIYISTEGNSNRDYKSLTGFGLELQHKIYIKNRTKAKGLYFAYGPTFNYYTVVDDRLTANEYVDNERKYIGLEYEDVSTKVYKIGANIMLGFHKVIGEQFFIDPYLGTAIRFSYDNQTTGLHGLYNDWWADIGYSGTLMIIGARFGVIF